jgi:hypothetical protein
VPTADTVGAVRVSPKRAGAAGSLGPIPDRCSPVLERVSDTRHWTVGVKIEPDLADCGHWDLTRRWPWEVARSIPLVLMSGKCWVAPGEWPSSAPGCAGCAHPAHPGAELGAHPAYIDVG